MIMDWTTDVFSETESLVQLATYTGETYHSEKQKYKDSNKPIHLVTRHWLPKSEIRLHENESCSKLNVNFH